MKYKKCPQCELNYIKEDEDVCEICKKKINPDTEEDNFMKNAKRNEIIKIGDTFPLSKNYKLINYLIGTNLQKWVQATYKLTNTYYMWITALDGIERAGWKDVLLKDGRIKENFVGDKANPPANFGKTFDYTYKAVFEKNGDSFTFIGVYKLDIKNTSLFERYYIKVSDTTTLKDF